MSTQPTDQEREDAAVFAGCGALFGVLTGRAILITAVIIGVINDGPLAGVMWSLVALLVGVSAGIGAGRVYKAKRKPPATRPLKLRRPDLN